MAGPGTSAEAISISTNSYDTALCIIPPRAAWSSVDRLRALYDKAYEKWPPHVNLIYPFVHPDLLQRATEVIESALPQCQGESPALLNVSLSKADVFEHKRDNTLYIRDDDQQRASDLESLRRGILKALGQKPTSFQMHMTIAQTEDVESDTHEFLLDKVGFLPTVSWEVDKLYILVRERQQLDGNATSHMKLWGTIDISESSLSRPHVPLDFYDEKTAQTNVDDGAGKKDQLQTKSSYYYEAETGLWMPYAPEATESPSVSETFTVSNYNVLAEFEWPPSRARYPLIVHNILSSRAEANALVLQEVTDDFLSYLLEDERIRQTYDFVSHGPPSQSDIEPLPSLLNIVILSKCAFEWEWVSFLRKHKGSLVAKFTGIGKPSGEAILPLVLAGVHLTKGLTDGAVTAKKTEIQRVLNYLSSTYPDNPWILAGDTNISTSTYSIEAALGRKAISDQSAVYLAGYDDMFTKAKLIDAWQFVRREIGDASDDEYDENLDKEVFQGEQGSTYDPMTNEVAARVVGSGFNMRPQRYDRILVRGQDAFTISKFNRFGYLKGHIDDDDFPEPTFASDHWGVRCVLRFGAPEELRQSSEEISKLIVPVDLQQATEHTSDVGSLVGCLSELGGLPTEGDMKERAAAFDLLKRIILDETSEEGDMTQRNRRPSVIVVPVGSYGLGVWTASSDIDCLCIGPFSSKTFFALAAQRLRKASTQGIRILRRVKANTGTMLELEVLGIKVDLQYAPATSVAEKWPGSLHAPATDPIWTLQAQTLSKLKAVRDLDYLRRSVPDISQFRLAHRTIKAWAKARGVYSAKFGYLGGIQISILLARVCKLLARKKDSVSVPDILATFFHHYASFDWQREIAFDPFFHRNRLQYHRTTREPLSILSYFPPSLNTSHAASLPSVRTLSEEFKSADAQLSDPETSWASFLGSSASEDKDSVLRTGVTDFLHGYKSYVKIDAQFWGLSSAKGAQFVGWLESRCVMLLVDISRRLPGIHSRIWPARFTLAAEQSEEGPGRDYQGYYLIGLDKLDPSMGHDELKVAFGALQTVLRRFEELMRGDEKYFDSKNCWMSTAVVGQADLGDLVVDQREWGEYTPGEEESDDEEEEDTEIGEAEGGAEREAYVPLSKKHRKPGMPDLVVPKLEPGKKFRTSADVLNRLRWDPELDSGDYTIGYLDRFVGPMERGLDAWKAEQTDEEFIPQHRILYFKRKSDGKIMWERRTKKDEIFGSGLE